MKAIAAGGEAYSVPYLLNRDSGGKPFDDVLVVGAGSGNDVESALAHGAKHVDAVEIDPAIYDLGRAHHPDHPYQDSRVTMHIEDGRSFLRNSPQKYDLVVYALVDSLMLYSGYSSIRLESFLFTQQAFDDIAARVKPGGMFVVYNFFRQGWIVGRIDKMAESAFGSRPIVISMPYVNSIRPEDPQANRFSMIIASHSAPAFSAIRQEFDLHQSFWINRRPSVNLQVEAFGPQPPALQGSTAADWDRIAPATVDTHAISLVPTDDWPFLYLHSREIPGLNNRSTVLIGVLSFVLLFVLSPGEKARPNWQMFFLGAGFMLLETEAVVHMALLFGSTWTVNSFVFFSILVMILIGNAFVIWIKPVKLWPYYVCLTASLLLNILVPMNRFLVLHQWEKIAFSCTVTFLPIFFAAIIFGTLFRDSTQPNVDFGSNVAGAIVGGLSEALTLMIGFNHLMITAVVFYLLSSIVKPTFLTHGLFVGSSVPRTSA
jgi:SAM-dependent methyltransferase